MGMAVSVQRLGLAPEHEKPLAATLLTRLLPAGG
jgi:hypothetical protein